MPIETDEPSGRPGGDEATPRGQRVVALGASAGGVEALTRIVRELPASFGAPILVVLHMPTTAVSRLPEILRRAGAMPASHASHGLAPRPGHIYVAPPDRHMVVSEGTLLLVEGPRENGVRPAADPLFRSVASWYRRRALGAVLSGTLDDGTAGLAAIRSKGGVTVAQDPADAIAPGMPASAIENVGVDHVVPAAAMPGLFTSFVAGQLLPVVHDRRLSSDASVPVDLICPECGGVLRQFSEHGLLRFHCRVGHTYSPDALYAAQDGRLEAALWAAIRSLEESASMARRLAIAARERGATVTETRYREREREAAERADVVRSALLAVTPLDEMPPATEPPPVVAHEEAEASATV
jgi:two-component system, chemotaxis family, protein-glutamate methylesterase/glutaminase